MCTLEYQTCKRKYAGELHDSANFESRQFIHLKSVMFQLFCSDLEASRSNERVQQVVVIEAIGNLRTVHFCDFSESSNLSIDFGNSDTLIHCVNFAFHSHFNRWHSCFIVEHLIDLELNEKKSSNRQNGRSKSKRNKNNTETHEEVVKFIFHLKFSRERRRNIK